MKNIIKNKENVCDKKIWQQKVYWKWGFYCLQVFEDGLLKSGLFEWKKDLKI